MSAALARRAARGALWVAAETWGLQVVQFALFLALARLLGPEAYGLIGIALTINVIGEALIAEGGWLEAIVQRRDLDRQHLDAAFWALLAMGVSLSLVALAGAPLLAMLFEQPQVAPLMALLTLALPLRSLTIVPEALLCRNLDFAPLAVRSLLSVAIAGGVGLALALNGAGVWSLVGLHLVQPLVGALVIWRLTTYRPAASVSYAHLRSLLPYVCTMLADRAVVAADSLLPRLFIGYVLGPGPLGHYWMARKLLELMVQLLTKPLTRVGLSGFAASAGKSKSLAPFLERAVVVGTAVAFPGFLGLALVAPDLVTLSLGVAWLPAIELIQILALWGIIQPVARLYAVLLYGVGRPGIQLAVNAGGLLLLLSLVGIVGPSSVTVVAALIVARACLVLPWHLFLVGRATGLNAIRPLVRTAPILAASGVMAAAVLAFRTMLSPQLDAMPLLLGSIALGIAAYGLMLVLLARPLVLDVATLLGLPRFLPGLVRRGFFPAGPAGEKR